MVNRERKVDVNKLSTEEADQLGVQIGDKVRGICDEAALKINQILGVYGMSAKIAIAFETVPEALQASEALVSTPISPKEKPAKAPKAPKKEAPAPKKSGRKSKQ